MVKKCEVDKDGYKGKNNPLFYKFIKMWKKIEFNGKQKKDTIITSKENQVVNAIIHFILV